MGFEKKVGIIGALIVQLLFLGACGPSNHSAVPGTVTLGPEYTQVVSDSQNEEAAKQAFQKNYLQTRSFLDDSKKSASGHLIHEIDSLNPYGAPIDIVPMKLEELHRYTGGSLGTARKRYDKATGKYKYQILVARNLNPPGDLAHGLAMGMEILKARLGTDNFFLANPEKHGEVYAPAFNALDQGAFKEYADEHDIESQFVLKILFFGQMKAYQLSKKMVSEGVDFPYVQNGSELGTEINKRYLTPLVPSSQAMTEDNAQSIFVQITNHYFSKISDFLTFLTK